MKNTPMGAEPSPGWIEALDLLDADLRRRNSAPRTRVAYRTDLVGLASWATAQGIEPAAVDHRILRRHAAVLSEAGNGPPTVARKIAAARALFRTLREHGLVEQNPAELVAAPKRARQLPSVLPADDVAALLD